MKKFFFMILLVAITLYGIAATPTTVRTVDKPYYNEYLALCKTKVLDTCLMVGTRTIPLLAVTYPNDRTLTNPDGSAVYMSAGKYLTQTRTLNSSMYNNPARKRTYKNVNKTVTTKPTVDNVTKEICWFPISYYCYYRKNSVKDFYEWYWLVVLKKPKFWT